MSMSRPLQIFIGFYFTHLHITWTIVTTGSGAIIVQLSQPFVVDSMRLLLWDCDDRAYSYTIEVSVDNVKWVMIKDNSNEPCRLA